MQKKNLLMKLSSWLFIIDGLLRLIGILLLETMGGTVLSDFFGSTFVGNKQGEVFWVLIVLIRVIIGIFCLTGISYDLCICLAFLLLIKDSIFMYYFYTTNVYTYLYRSVPEFLLVMVYVLGMIHFKYRET